MRESNAADAHVKERGQEERQGLLCSSIIWGEFNGTVVSIGGGGLVIERSPVRYTMPAVMLDLSSLSKNLTLALCLGGTLK